MDTAILARYKAIRKDHVSFYAGTGKRYHYKCRAESALKSARYYVEIHTKWDNAGDNVRLNILPDYNADLDFLMGDSFNPEVNPEIQPHVLKRQKDEFIQQVNADGVYGISGEYWNGEEWIAVDSCWGFVGDGWRDSGYDLDIMSATLEEFEKLKLCECCGRPKIKNEEK